MFASSITNNPITVPKRPRKSPLLPSTLAPPPCTHLHTVVLTLRSATAQQFGCTSPSSAVRCGTPHSHSSVSPASSARLLRSGHKGRVAQP
ncbi:hypothetical protein AOQ84DRAFT_352272 [Glonium stellatum]|uniref:Uncharacterized protein n=1 Tax=Glonium stellatum TaxID=574774 RepID=A0A8E2F994_9PEZI|nr:hypothetical protein AOQ84DRAFT_352272 [Glonium stellatum]